MKKRIGTLKGKPIVEGGGSNIIKENEININDIGSSSGSGDSSEDDGMLYFGGTYKNFYNYLLGTASYLKVVDYRTNNDGSIQGTYINVFYSTDSSKWFFEFGINPNKKNIYFNNKWLTFIDLFQEDEDISFLKLEYFKPISKEEFYRTEYTVEEADKIAQEYDDYTNQFAPSKTE